MLAGCATSPLDEPPRLSLANIQIEQMGLFNQEFILTVKAQNPNDIALDVKGMTFDLEVNGEHFASGVSDQPVFVPAFSTETFDIAVSSSLGGIMGQLDSLMKKGNIDYILKGKMKLNGFPFSVPFKQRGEIELLPK